MRSLATASNRYLFFLVGMITAILILITLFALSMYRIESMSSDYRSALSQINIVISELNRLRATGPEDRNYDSLAERIRSVQENSTIEDIAPAAALGIETLPELLLSETISFSQAIQETGSVARALSDRFYQKRSFLLLLAVINLILNIVAIVSLLVITLFLRKAILRFHERIGKSINVMKEALDYSSKSLQLDPPNWEEERLLNSSVEQLATRIEEDRLLREMELQNNLDALLPEIKKVVSVKMPCDRLALAFLDTQNIVIAEAAASNMGTVHLEPGFTEHISTTTLGSVIRRHEPRIINDLEHHYAEINQSVSTRKILAEGIHSSITVPLMFEKRCVGFLFISSRHKNAYHSKHAVHAGRIAHTLKQNLYYTYILQQLIAQAASAFVKMTEKKDNETSLHILRMARYSYLIARQLRQNGTYPVTPRFMREILWFAPLHDIGKIGIPDSILLKPGRLDPAEWEVMVRHVTIGEEVICSMDKGIRKTMDSSLLSTAIDIISCHHEKWDGSGYPKALRGEGIPLAGRIVAIADVFDALTSRRPYKEPFPLDKAMDIIRRGRATHFDPAVVDAFEEALPEILKIYETHKEV